MLSMSAHLLCGYTLVTEGSGGAVLATLLDGQFIHYISMGYHNQCELLYRKPTDVFCRKDCSFCLTSVRPNDARQSYIRECVCVFLPFYVLSTSSWRMDLKIVSLCAHIYMYTMNACVFVLKVFVMV